MEVYDAGRARTNLDEVDSAGGVGTDDESLTPVAITEPTNIRSRMVGVDVICAAEVACIQHRPELVMAACYVTHAARNERSIQGNSCNHGLHRRATQDDEWQ